MNTTIQLKTEKKITYFATELTEKQANFIVNNKDDKDKLAIASIKLEIDCTKIDLIGSLDDSSHYILGKYVDYLKGYAPRQSRPDSKIQFRDYTRTEERQLKTAWLVSVCEDARTSARTLVKALKSPYVCIWHKEN